MTQTSMVEVDADFARHIRAREPMPFAHALVGEQLLGLEAIAQLGAELGPQGISAERAQKGGLVADDDRSGPDLSRRDIAAEIRELAANDSWFTLLNIENSPRYRDLVDRVLDQLGQATGFPPGQMRRRMGFVFASSPNSVTSAHFDIEQSLLFQLEGRRRLGFGRFADAAQRQHEVDRYWGGDSFGRLEQLPEQTQELEIGPGSAVYIPPWTPHWLINGDNTSLSLTLTFFERSNEDESLAQAFNARLRGHNIATRPYGERPAVDRLKVRAMRGYRGVKRLVRPGSGDVSASH